MSKRVPGLFGYKTLTLIMVACLGWNDLIVSIAMFSVDESRSHGCAGRSAGIGGTVQHAGPRKSEGLGEGRIRRSHPDGLGSIAGTPDLQRHDAVAHARERG